MKSTEHKVLANQMSNIALEIQNKNSWMITYFESTT